MTTTGVLAGKAALVTGASRGIGLAIARALAAAGAKVAMSATQEERLRAAADDVAKGGAEVMAKTGDVSRSEDAAALVEAVVASWGRLDILVNNAGITRDNLLLRMKDDDWDRVLAVNLRGAFLLTRAAAKTMIRQRDGRIVNITSIVGLRGNAGQANYSAAKAGLVALTQSSARELASRNILVNAVAPGFIPTDMTAAIDEKMKEQMLQMIPLGRMGSAEDVAHAVLFLAGPGAGYITGQVLVVDGGLLLT